MRQEDAGKMRRSTKIVKTRRARVVVVGSLNIDYIASVDRLPKPGETVLGNSLVQRFGGKGANQAVAAARQGARVAMIGCLGSDDHGTAYLSRMRNEGIDISAICRSKHVLTGTALIAVDSSAENLIIVAPAANERLKPQHVRANRKLIESADVVLLQFEVPMPAVLEAIRIANTADVPVLLNPSPLRDGFPWGSCRIAALIANEGEAQQIFGLSADGPAEGWSARLKQRNIGCVIITRGAKSTVAIRDSRQSETGVARLSVPAMAVQPVDTVGAGDAFAGTFATRIAERAQALLGCRVLEEVVLNANCAGALATLKPGAQESIPNRAATERAAKRLLRPGEQNVRAP